MPVGTINVHGFRGSKCLTTGSGLVIQVYECDSAPLRLRGCFLMDVLSDFLIARERVSFLALHLARSPKHLIINVSS